MWKQDECKKILGKIIPAVEKEYLKKYPKFGNNYVEMCQQFYKSGASSIQIILEASEKKDLEFIESNLGNLNTIVGGSIENIKEAEILLNRIANFIVVGRLFVFKPENISAFVKKFQEKLICSLDDTDGFLTYKKKTQTLIFLKQLLSSGVRNFVYVNDKTKLKGGINLKMFETVRELTKECNLIYSGGIQTLEDIVSLKRAGADSVIVGTALYNGSLDLVKAAEILKP